ncbi:hypothetical protein [Rhizobium bangladeshense]|uniref:hypothetical protein n=1 Tax=Rhizobium bangladeshense TaxID=1138189 RepID=UPI001C83A7D4|nr:hypothetical protein [Rhizobium bangladeshense]MBX4869898.1 hypothetical protein [Rhizobium bangladeshense]MBX4886221.1 hypothetical protein [Rhizobium bangladeshense]MBX4904903.1 hypothetical protein [Rhizobium bangladeshense]MBX4917045.1 hypothetical protein [Rhizobium bangladeshense]MBX4923188.1 hypothetical protein [Rhizobium bangladeshense]
MPYEIVTASLDVNDKSGRIDVWFGPDMKTIVVSRRALLSVASPPRATEFRLLQYVETFCQIAARRLASTSGNTILITANDVRGWLCAWQSSPAPVPMQAVRHRLHDAGSA